MEADFQAHTHAHTQAHARTQAHIRTQMRARTDTHTNSRKTSAGGKIECELIRK